MICNRLEKCVDEKFSGKAVTVCSNGINDTCIISSDRRSKVQCEERKKKYILDNTQGNQVLSYKFDGGVIVEDKTVPQGTLKCDHMFVVGGEEQKVILIELKGIDAVHALRQIRETLKLFESFFIHYTHVYGRVVISSMAPKLRATPDFVNLQRLLLTKYRGNIKIGEKKMIERDVDLND